MVRKANLAMTLSPFSTIFPRSADVVGAGVVIIIGG
jgi:hypothetical protein